jgi:hypothetical protein
MGYSFRKSGRATFSMMNKKPQAEPAAFADDSQKSVTGMNCVVGACVHAGAAVNASIGVDLEVGIALRDRTGGADIDAAATADASVIDNICHNSITSMYLVISIINIKSEIASPF